MLIFGEEETPEYTTGSCGTRVEVSKMGGGTVGREYTGRWIYAVYDVLGNVVASGDDYVTGMPHTHRWVARDIASLYLEEEDDNERRWLKGHGLY